MAKLILKTDPHTGRQIALDTETTGLSPRYGARIVELAAIELIDGRETGNSFHSYINPQCEVPYEAYVVHGLSDEFLADKPTFAEIADDFLSSATTVRRYGRTTHPSTGAFWTRNWRASVFRR